MRHLQCFITIRFSLTLFRFLRISVNAIVSKHHQSQGVDARKWCEHCTQAIGNGKGGGKADMASATYQGSDSLVVDDILRLANEFWYQLKLDH